MAKLVSKKLSFAQHSLIDLRNLGAVCVVALIVQRMHSLNLSSDTILNTAITFIDKDLPATQVVVHIAQRVLTTKIFFSYFYTCYNLFKFVAI